MNDIFLLFFLIIPYSLPSRTIVILSVQLEQGGGCCGGWNEQPPSFSLTWVERTPWSQYGELRHTQFRQKQHSYWLRSRNEGGQREPPLLMRLCSEIEARLKPKENTSGKNQENCCEQVMRNVVPPKRYNNKIICKLFYVVNYVKQRPVTMKVLLAAHSQFIFHNHKFSHSQRGFKTKAYSMFFFFMLPTPIQLEFVASYMDLD